MNDRGRRPRRPAAVHVFGPRSAVEAIRSGRAIEVLADEHAEGARRVVAEAERSGVRVDRVGRADLDRIAGGTTHQGVAVRVRPIAPLDERALAETPWPDDAIAVVLDGVTDPQNVGAAARAAEAAGASVLVIRERRAAPVTPGAVRASAGALMHLPVARVANIRRALDRLRDRGFTVAGLDVAASSSIYDAERPTGPLALVVGSEGSGLSRLVREGCDELLAIPMRGRVGSLNAATAVAAALWGFALRPPAGGGEGPGTG